MASWQELFVAVGDGDRQAFSAGSSHLPASADDAWKIYVLTDRPAYRPDERANWKLTARRYDGSVYSTPAGEMIEFEIIDSRGTGIAKGKVELNRFGSAWSSVEITGSMPLGEYQVRFWDDGRHRRIGEAVLFRVEEYKLPEFRVSVETPDEDGKKRAFRPGEQIEFQVAAEYFFGGTVAGADVEVLVYQLPFSHWWSPARKFPWFHEGRADDYRHRFGGGETQVHRDNGKTDAAGRAVFSFAAPGGGSNDFEYRIEARVTRQPYYVHPRARHNLYRPQDRVEIDIRTIDANDNPVEASGTVRVVRDSWLEAWWDPAGNLIRGRELDEWKRRSEMFPPPPRNPADRPWQLQFRGYRHEEILSRRVKTDRDGEAEFRFVPALEGYYRVSWSSREDAGRSITAETTVWVATGATTEIGYRHGGVEILVDKDTFHAGGTTPVLLSVPAGDRFVLFTVEGEELYQRRLIHIEGTVKLIELEIDASFVPNVFLGAVMVSDRELFQDTRMVVVPPVEHFLDVELAFDRELYRPRQEGILTVITRDHQGRPVPAELSLGVVDESVFSIQEDYAGDPRRFFFGGNRPQLVGTDSSFQQKRYRKLRLDQQQRFSDVAARPHGMEESDSNGQMGFARGLGGRLEAATSKGKINQLRSLGYLGDAVEKKSVGAPSEPGAAPAVQVRHDFRSTMFWQPDVITDETGRGTVRMRFPDSLTGWRGTVRAVTQGNRFGIQTITTRTKKPLIVRLQAPRFFVAGDTATISAVIHNNTGAAISVTPGLMAEGLERIGQEAGRETEPSVRIDAGGEARVDWQVRATEPGPVTLEARATGGRYADAVRRSYFAYEHGIEKLLAKSGKLQGDEVTVPLSIPAERRPGSTRLTVQVASSLAVTMLDALPYLIDYPYGCTEQTMSRFLPAAITARTLRDLGLRPDDISGRIFGGIERENSSATHPGGRKDLRELDGMVKKGWIACTTSSTATAAGVGGRRETAIRS